MYLHDIANAIGLEEDLSWIGICIECTCQCSIQTFGAIMYVQCKLDRYTLDNK